MYYANVFCVNLIVTTALKLPNNGLLYLRYFGFHFSVMNPVVATSWFHALSCEVNWLWMSGLLMCDLNLLRQTFRLNRLHWGVWANIGFTGDTGIAASSWSSPYNILLSARHMQSFWLFIATPSDLGHIIMANFPMNTDYANSHNNHHDNCDTKATLRGP